MDITQIKVESFKRIREITIDLEPINIFVGGNNSGKSSVLEGIHFSIAAAVASRLADTKTFTQQSLLFCPTPEFVQLRNGAPYKNQSNFGYLRVYATESDDEYSCNIKIYRGRNEGNVGCEVTGSAALRQIMTGTERPFSIYVPGLSGIPQVEERRTESIIRRGVASGDANLYLRNVLLLINESGKLDELVDAIRVVFPSFNLFIEFDQERDLYISVGVSITGPHGKRIPIELVGTGVQQALQIFSYIVLFRPYVLLLDEPDSHLHPDNQGLLAKSLSAIASETDTKVLISTHSRHLVDTLYDDGNVIWMKDGRIFQQGDDVVRVPLLMDLGALDSFEKIREGDADWVFLSEDASLDLARRLLRASGYEDEKLVVYSYKTSSNLQSALALSEFITEIAPKTRVIIHLDRDFMTEQEVTWVSERIEGSGAIPFITEGVDVESYFTRPQHIACLLGVNVIDVETWLDEIAVACHNELCHKFTRKRDDAKALYRQRPESPPETLDLIGPDNPLPTSKRLGKLMLRKVRGGLHTRFGVAPDVTAYSEHIASERLAAIRNCVDA